MAHAQMLRALRLAPLFAAVLAVGLLAGCVSNPDKDAAARRAEAAPTPTEQYPLKAERRAYQILLAPHASGLSQAQTAAVARVAARWTEEGTGLVVIREPRKGADPVAISATADAARIQLIALGVPADRITREAYDPENGATIAVTVAFALAEAVIPECGRAWENLASNSQNRPMDNFGCAVTANMAAQIADPADITGPRPTDPPDAARRMTVLGKYEQGVQTGTADKQSTITISGVAAGGGN